ncbi:thiol-disulfide isomerase/thioredoxin [Rhizomicrobium palustre]|uniref:Thiol-disulfide isomerase/thioredoxin n=1 Tax=Rhizomicrobium palustre TaxID=189966 RepID=A0A846MY33_9PROT|nr:thiol-disulfide isomerase/thioredoxin [Rhizomicrobium palustre]
MTKPRLLVLVILGGVLLLSVLYWKMGPNGKAEASLGAPPAALTPFKLAKTPVAVPAVAFAGAGGAVQTLSAYKGKVVLLNLWAPWCGPCVKELPALAALQKAIPAEKFVVVPVDVSRDAQPDAAAFLKSHGVATLPAYVDSNAAVIRTFGAVGLPMTILIGKDGREIGRAEGAPDWSNPEVVAWIKAVAEG